MTGENITKKIDLELVVEKSEKFKTVSLEYLEDGPPLPSMKEDQIMIPKPELGPILESIRTNDCRYICYEHSNVKKNVGYLHITTFEHGQHNEPFQKRIEDFEKLIEEAEKKTDLLVVDLRNNFGGSVSYSLALTSFFMPHSPKMGLLAELITQHSVKHHQSRLKKIDEWLKDGIPLDIFRSSCHLVHEYELIQLNRKILYELRDYSLSLLGQWNNGKIMTQWKAPFLKLPVDPKKLYTKPIVLLVNENTFSASEVIMASILQDSKRALIFGVDTAGAGAGTGGSYYNMPMIGPCLIGHLQFPTIFFKRVDGEPIENIGVKPDIACPMTLADFKNRVIDFNKSLSLTIEEILKKN